MSNMQSENDIITCIHALYPGPEQIPEFPLDSYLSQSTTHTRVWNDLGGVVWAPCDCTRHGHFVFSWCFGVFCLLEASGCCLILVILFWAWSVSPSSLYACCHSVIDRLPVYVFLAGWKKFTTCVILIRTCGGNDGDLSSESGMAVLIGSFHAWSQACRNQMLESIIYRSTAQLMFSLMHEFFFVFKMSLSGHVFEFLSC